MNLAGLNRDGGASDSRAIPDRLSVDDQKRLGFPMLRVFLDGVEQLGVVEYDVPAGRVVRHARSDTGRPIINSDRSGLVTEEVRGVVTVEVKQ